MEKEGLTGLRVLSVAASVAFAAAGIYVATSARPAAEPATSAAPDATTALMAARVERTMLAAQVVASSPTIASAGLTSMGPRPEANADRLGTETARPQLPAEAAEAARGPATLGLAAQVSPATETSNEQGQAAVAASQAAGRGSMSPANVAAREIAVAESAKEIQRMAQARSSALAPLEGEDATAGSAPRQFVEADSSPDTQGETVLFQPAALIGDFFVGETQRLLFVQESQIVLDDIESSELIAFAQQKGYNTLAMDASGVGYGDEAITAGFARFTADATEAGIETFALIGHPWFTVAADAGIPGQPTSSVEGLAILNVIAASGLFDGVVDDSHPYGVVYELNGESRNRLFDDPVLAGLDFQAWLRAAKEAIGDLPLIKTTPFWYDTHPALQDLVNLDGEGSLTLGHLVAAEVDTMAVLASRDTLLGPNGVFELVAGELAIGCSIITLEASDLGPDLGFLTFHEEGLEALESATDGVRSYLLGHWAFSGTGAHHYRPIAQLAADNAEAPPFGFVALDSANAAFGSLIDAYDSSIGSYTDQLVFAPELNAMAGPGQTAILSNGRINLDFGALVHGNVVSGPDGTVTKTDGTRISGELISLTAPLVAPTVLEADTAGAQRLDLQYREQRTISGDAAFSSVSMNSSARLNIVGPATISLDGLRMNSDSRILADTTFGPVTLLINDQLNLGSTAVIAPMNGTASDLTVHYSGVGSVIMGFRTNISADIFAPNAAIELGTQAEIFGRAMARSLVIRSSAKLHLDLDLQR